MHKIEQQYLNDIVFKLNSLPKKIFDFQTTH